MNESNNECGPVVSIGVFVAVAVFVAVTVGISAYLFGASQNRGKWLDNNDVPVGVTMEIRASSSVHPDQNGMTYVLAVPFGSKETPKYYIIDYNVPKDARCFVTTRSPKDGWVNPTRFVTCPTPYHDPMAPVGGVGDTERQYK